AQSKSSRRQGDESQIKTGKSNTKNGNKMETPHVVSYNFPGNYDDVLALPGIGRYTAGAICSIAFNQPTPILDGNVIRVLSRIFGIAENPKEKTTNARLWRLAEELVTHARDAKIATVKKSLRPLCALREENSCSFLNQSLMELGAIVCSPRNPQCLICPAQKLCVAFKENRVEELPNLGKRETATARHFIAFAVEHNGRFLVRQRPAGVVNAHLWEFPNVESANGKPDAAKLFDDVFGIKPARFAPLCTVKHSITRYRITLEAFSASMTKQSTKTDGVWKTPSQMQRLAFTSAHKKILSKLSTAKTR
ncbi:MAG TPA: NUDIX domain-containing protein, partial [Candidatus Binatia bacterium]|nr:NUDIX domain-containing protein [Candidatus Binatia bacterium]